MARVNADNKLLNYGLNEKEEAKASSGGFGNWFADLNQYIRAGGIIGGLAGMTKPLWYDKLSDEARQRLDNYVDRSTFLPRKMTEGMAKSVEGIVDTAALLGVMNTMPFSKDAREAVKEFTERDFVGEWYNRDAYKHRDDGLLKDDGLVAQGAQAVGGMLPSVIGAIATGGSSVVAQGATKLPQIVSLGTTAAGAMGNAAESAYQDGAGFGGGLAYGAAIGGIEAATEKLVGGGLDKVFGGGWLDDIIPIGDWAKTGIGRYAANAVGEGFEEMTSEAVDPLAKAIYKGKDAFADYDLGDHIKDIGKAGLMGAAISSIYGGAFDAMGGGVKQGDIQNVISDMESIREQSDKLKVKNNFTAEYGKKADSQTLGDLRIIEKTLKGVDENKRADLINKNGLSGLFETDGSLKADYAEALSKESEFDRRYFDEEYRAHEGVIKSDLAELNSELEDRFGENAKKVSVYSGELTQRGKAAYTKLQRAQKIFNELSGRHNGIIVTDESPNFNGKLVGDSRIYISADTLESGAWAGTLVHENMHFAEGTEEYNRLVSLLEADTELEAKAVEAVMNKSGYGFDKATLDIIGKRISAGENVEQGARLAYELYRSEINAHMGEAMLGTEAFINRVVRTDAPLAEKIIGKILDLKEAFGRIGDTEAQAQHKRLAEAERMYLDAIEAAGKKFENGKIVSADDDDEEKEKTAESGGKYSFGGEHAKTADKLKFENAKQLLANGVDSEVIRKETGWFKGYDGKWRFEIDDSNMTVTIPKGNHVTVGDIVKHQKLFEAYPDLKDIWVTFHDLENARGSYSRMFGDIELSKKLLENPQELKSVISHELQHAIQDKEGFSKGASVEYWERKLVEGYDSRQAYIKAEEKALLDQIKAMRYEDKEFVWAMEDLLKQRPNHPRGAINWDTLEKIEEDSPQWKHFDKERDSLSKTYGDGKVSNFLTISGRLERMKHTAERDALQLYYETAGEIEARDVQERLHLDVTERKNIRPDIDQEDVVFADLSTVSMDVATDNHGHQVVVLYKDVMANQSGKPHQIIANLIANHIGDVYSIIESGQKVYIGEDLPNEYTQSEYTKNLLKYRAKIMKVKNQIVQNFGEVIEIATNRRWEKAKHTHNKDAKYGFYRYKSRCALPLFDRNHNVIDAKIYNFELLIRNASDGRKYLYDIVEIKRETSSSLSQSWIAKMDKNSSRSLNNSISQNSEKSTPKSKFSFKENSSDAKNATSYTKAEAVEMVDGIMESLLSFEWGYGELKNRASVIKQAHAMLNGAEAGKRHGEALKFADYLIEHVVLSERVDHDMLAPYADKIEMLKPYLHKLNLDSIRGEINYRYDKGNRPYLRWAKRNGERGIGVDVMAMELEEQGYILSSRNPADMFFEIDDDYREAVEALKKNAQTAVKETFTADELKQLRNDIAKDIMASFDDRDFSLSKLKQIAESRSREAERLREENAKLRKEAWRQSKVAERAIAKKNEAEENARKADEARRENEDFSQAANRVLKLVREVKNWKSGVFESAAEANGDVFKGIVGKLSGIEIKGNISATATRKIMRELAGWYGAADMYPIVKELKDADIWDEGALEAMKAIGDDKKIDSNAKLTKAELGLTESVIRHLKQVVERYHRVFRAGKYIDAKPLAEDYIRIIGENAKIKVGRVAKLIDGKYYEYFGDAEALMKWHDRYNKNGFFTATFNELREGALNMAIAQMQMRGELDDFLDKNGKFLSRITNEKIEVEGLEMTRAEAISLYMTARREHAEGGLAVGGFEVVDKETGQKHGVDGLVETEYKAGEELELEKLQGLVGKLQRTLYSQFSETERRYIAIVERILNNECKRRKHDTDVVRLGYSNTLEGYYYPIRRGHLAQKIGEDTLGAELGRIRSLSFNQNTVHGAKGRLLIEPVNQVVDRHIAGIAMYENISIPIDNFNRLFNLDISGNRAHPQTIATALSGEGGWAEAGKYIDKLIKDIEGIKSVDKWESKALGFIRSGFVKFQLGANPKTWVTQLSSLFASMSVLDPKYVGLAMKSKTRGKAFGAELDKYSALAKLRNSENTAALAQGVIDELGKVGDVLMKPIGATDRFVIKKLWYACQLQVEAEQKLKLGTEENKVAAAKLLEKVIFETQQNSLLTEKSAAMRSNSELIKGFTMFSSDAMKMTARIVDAYGRISVIKEKLKGAEGDVKKSLEAELKEATGEFKRASGSAVAVAAFMSLIALAFSHFYGKRDEEETLGEAAATFGADFAGNLLGGLPLVRDVYSYIADGYELNHYAISYVNDLLSGINGLFALTNAAFTGERVTAQEVASKTKAALFGLGQVFGIPLRNAYNVGRGLVGGASLITGNGKSFGYAWDSFFYDKSYTADLNKAIEAGDDKLVSQISALMVGESFDGVDKSVSDELRRLIATGADVLPRAVGDSITYDGEEYAFTLRQRRRFDDIYGTADEALADMVKLKQYKLADDKAKAQAVRFLYDTYYQLAVDDMLGVDSMAKNVLFAEAIDIEKLAIIVAQARMFTADKDKKGNSINGTKKLKVLEFLESLSLNAAQKHMILGYLGYKQSVGEPKVTAYVSRLKLTSAEKKALMRYSGYAV